MTNNMWTTCSHNAPYRPGPGRRFAAVAGDPSGLAVAFDLYPLARDASKQAPAWLRLFTAVELRLAQQPVLSRPGTLGRTHGSQCLDRQPSDGRAGGVLTHRNRAPRTGQDELLHHQFHR